ncbi:MAG: condensation domain-containing protein, partial [Tumebacillaceae bacterium]
GPTECCIDSTYHICEPGSRLRTVPIGKPIANAQALVLDERMKPVSVGVLGELYIGGMGVALGYLHRPELTAERFVRHVFEESSEQTERLYKTGDQVRRLSDGNLEYVGRADDQVKMRGFRIELGEIEKVIGQYDDVREAVVIAHEYAPGDTRLVGYFVPEANAKPAVDHVRDHLKGKLPDYMVPATLVMLDELPLSPSGKVNRKALPIPEMEAQQKQGTYIAPRNPMEELLERIFGQVLHHEKVGVHDNFFDLGGHSLLATQVVSRIRNTFGVNLPLSELFSTPTIAHLAKRVQALMQTGQSQDLPLLPVSREEDLQLSYAQERLWFMEQLISASYSMPIPLRLEGTLHVPALEQALQEIVRRHETLRTTFTEKQGRVVQVIAPTQAFSLRQIDLTALSEPERTAEVERRLVEDVERAFDLTQGPLFDAQLLLLSAEEHVLLISMHHIITDGWSIGILLQELSVLYEAYASAKPALLPDLPIQYVDYAHWQRKWLQGDELERQVSYWKTQLGGELPVLQLPFDRPRPEQPSFKGGHVLFDIPALTGTKLQELSQQETATLFMTMLATYQVLLYRFSGQEDILVGTPVANRNRSEVEHLIGDFINTLVMRSHLFDSLTFRELVRSVRETALSAYANQDVPFEKLIEELQPERSRNFTPLFQVWFLLLSEEPRLELDGLTGTMIDVVGKQTKWELTLGIADRAEGMKAILEYSADLFDRDTVELMSRTYLFLLEQVAESPDIRMRDLLESIEQAEAQYRAEMQKQIDEKRKSKFKRSR